MDAPHGCWLSRWRKSLTAITQECCEQYCTSPGDSTPQSRSYTATYHPSWKLSKLDKPDIWDSAGELETSLWVMYSCGPLHMDEQRQDVQLKPTYSSSVPIRDVAPEDLPKAMDDREVWRERVRNIWADSNIWWWWWVMNGKTRNHFAVWKQMMKTWLNCLC